MRVFHFIEKVNFFMILTFVPLMLYWEVDDPNIVKKVLFQLAIFIWTLIYFIKVLKTKLLIFPQNHLSYSVILFLLTAGLSIASSNHPLIGSIRLELMVYFALLFFLVSQLINDQKEVLPALKVVCFGAFVVSGFGVFQYFGLDLFPVQRDPFRVSATLGHPNFLAGYLVCILPVTTGLFLSCRSPKKKYLYALCLVVQSSCLLFTLSRAAWTSAIVSFIFFWGVYLKFNKLHASFQFSKKKVAFLFVIIGGLATAFASVIEKTPESEISRLTSLAVPTTQNTLWIRWLEWKGALQVIANAPITGNGLGTFSILFPTHQPPEFSSICVERDEFLRHAHNEYLEIWSETGILGLGLFLYVLIIAISWGIRLAKLNKNGPSFFWLVGLISGLLGVIFQMLFSVSFRFIVVPLMFWSFLGVINGVMSVRMGKIAVWKLEGAKSFIFIGVMLLLIGLLFLSMTRTFSHLSAERYFHDGLVSYEAGALKTALNDIQLAINRCNIRPEIYYKKGALESKLGLWPEALATYKALQKIHPDFCHTNFNLSLCYLHLTDIENAIRSGNREVRLYPDFAEQYYLLGKAYYLNKTYDEAEDCFSKYLQRHPNSASAHSYLGNISAFHKDWENAIFHYEKILSKDPENIQARLNISQIYMEMRDIKRACENLNMIPQETQRLALLGRYKGIFTSILNSLENSYNKEYLIEICPNLSGNIKNYKDRDLEIRK